MFNGCATCRVVLERLGELKLRNGDIAEALVDNEEALAIRRRLARGDPKSVDRQADISISLERVGDLKLYGGDTLGALPDFEEMLAIRRRLVDRGARQRRAGAKPRHGPRQGRRRQASQQQRGWSAASLRREHDDPPAPCRCCS